MPDLPPEQPAIPLRSFTPVELAAGVASELASTPHDEAALDLSVWMFVAGERQRGAGPGRVINQLVQIVDDACIEPASRHDMLVRSVVVSSVEAYFGFRTGGQHGPAGQEYTSDSHGTVMQANRLLKLVP
jgi:hypothetical protein